VYTPQWVEAGQDQWQGDCSFCNGQKGTDIASIDPETERLMPLFHPRRQDWARHFRLEAAIIVPLTGIGRVTEFLLS
jgi:hypothetical protein